MAEDGKTLAAAGFPAGWAEKIRAHRIWGVMSGQFRLDSWKEIARYLGRDVSTVIRWEQHRGLPVHRVPGGRLPRVFAYTEELDEWLANRPSGPNGEDEAAAVMSEEDPGAAAPLSEAERDSGWWRLALAGAVGALVAIAGVAAWTLRAAADPLQRVEIAGNELHALDASGRMLWTHRFEPAGGLSAIPTRWNYVDDLDADGRRDVVTTVDIRPPGSGVQQGELRRFAADGTPVWSARVEDRLIFGGGEYGPPWVAADVTAYRAGAGTRIAWSVHHFTWWPSLLVTLDSNGRRLGAFVNSGWISGVTVSPDGRHLLVSGVTNASRAYFFAVLDAERPFGRSPEPPRSETECVTCPPGDPLHYVVLPRTDVGGQYPFPAPGPVVQAFDHGGIQVQTLESEGPKVGAVIYELSPDFEVRQARLSDSFWEWHRRLEAEGRLNHAADQCPHREAFDVRHWTPQAGWQIATVRAR